MYSLVTAVVEYLNVVPCGTLQISTGLQPFPSKKHVACYKRVIQAHVEQLLFCVIIRLLVELDASLSQAIGGVVCIKPQPVGDKIF